MTSPLSDDRPSAPPELRGGSEDPGGFLWALAVVLACGLAAFAAARPPAPLGADATAGVFSAERALAVHARLFPEERPRPVGSAEHAAVRRRIVAALEELGLAPEVQDTVGASPSGRDVARVRNVLARLPGARPGPGVLLVAHYDSVQAGPGAADDGAGVAALLEIARALRAGEPLRHDVLLLVSDAEEVGLVGAEAFVREHPWAEEVGAVVNLEMRGTSGLALAFETGPGSGALVRALASEVRRPAANSLAAEVYRRMPNDTDFTVFREAGHAGVNLAAIEGWARYHTPRDVRAALDLGTLQHLGESALAAARVAADGRAEAGGELVFTDLLGRGFLAWPAGWSPLLALLALAANLWTARRLAASGALGPAPARSVGRGALRLLALLLGALVLGLALPLVLGALTSHPLPGVVDPRGPRLANVAATLLLVVLVAERGRFWAAERAVALAASLAALALAFVAPGASFLPLVPALAAGILPALSGAMRAPDARGPRRRAVWLAAGAAALLGLPIWVQVENAFGAGAAVATTVPLALLGAWLLPPATSLGARTRRTLAVLALGGIALGLVLEARAPAFDADHPQKVNVLYVVEPEGNDGEGRATLRPWPLAGEAPEEMVAALPGAEEGGLFDWAGGPVFASKRSAVRERRRVPVAEAPPSPLPAPLVERSGGAREGGRVLRVRSIRGAASLHVVLRAGEVRAFEVLGGRFEIGNPKGDPRLSLWGFGDEEIKVELEAGTEADPEADTAQGAPEEPELLVFDADPALPPAANALLEARPETAVPAHLGDLSIVVAPPVR